MRSYELTFLFGCVVDSVPMYPFDTLIVRETSFDESIVKLINEHFAVITGIIEKDVKNKVKCIACNKEFGEEEGYTPILCSFKCGLDFWQPY